MHNSLLLFFAVDPDIEEEEEKSRDEEEEESRDEEEKEVEAKEDKNDTLPKAAIDDAFEDMLDIEETDKYHIIDNFSNKEKYWLELIIELHKMNQQSQKQHGVKETYRLSRKLDDFDMPFFSIYADWHPHYMYSRRSVCVICQVDSMWFII